MGVPDATNLALNIQYHEVFTPVFRVLKNLGWKASATAFLATFFPKENCHLVR
jgi:hypothetical protein